MRDYLLTRIKVLTLLTSLLSLVLSPAQARNLVQNGSFEIGMGKWIGWETGSRTSATFDQITLAKPNLISSTEHHLGRQSFCWTWPGQIRNQYMKLDKSKRYTISFYAKAKGGNEWISASVNSSYRVGEGGGDNQQSEAKNFKIESEWKRYQGTVSLPESLNGYYKLWISHQGLETVWIDDIQLEAEETATDYGPGGVAEIGMSTGRETDSNLFYTGETVPVRTLLHVQGNSSRSMTVNYTVYDYRNRKIREIDRSVTLDAEGYGQDDLKLDVKHKGLMSLVATVEINGKQSGQEELTFAVVSPPTPPSSKDEDSPLGVHVMGEWPIRVAEKLGIRWHRALAFHDMDGALYWSDVETEDGKFIFRDKGIDRLTKHHMGILGIFWTSPVPKWALNERTGKSTDLPRLDKYQRFVREMVSHYKGRIKYWEVWNEPYSSAWWTDTPEAYFELMKATYEEAKKADPDCKIVGANQASLDYGTVRNFTTRLFDAGGLNYMDIFSIHALGGYMMPDGPTMPEELCPWTGAGKTATTMYREITDLMRSYGKVLPMWNSETDVWSIPYSRLYPWVEDNPWTRSYPPMPPDLGADYLVQSTVVSMANNVSKSFFYLFQGANGRYEEDMNQTLMAWDLSLKPTAVACSEFLRELGQAKFARQIDWGDVARCYVFDAPEGAVAVAWGLRGWKKPGILYLPAKAVKLRYVDIMGNQRVDLARSGDECRLSLGSEPVYIKAKDRRTLEDMLSHARITGLVPDKVAKILSTDASLKGKLEYIGQKSLAVGFDAYAFSRGKGGAVVLVSTRNDKPALTLRSVPNDIKVTYAGKIGEVGHMVGSDLQFVVGETPVIVMSDGLNASELLAAVGKAEIAGLDDMEIEGTWITAADRKLYLSVRMRNTGGVGLSSKVDVKSLPEGISVETRSTKATNLLPDRSAQVDIPVSDPGRPQEVSGNARLEIVGGGKSRQANMPLNLAYSLKAERPIKVDGDLSEWTSEGAWTIDRKEQVLEGQDKWTGKADLSARVRSRWTDEFVFLALEVKDDYPARRKDVGQMFNGTSVEVFLDSNQREDLGRRIYDRDDFHMIFGPATPGTSEDALLIAPDSGLTQIPGLAMKSKRTFDGYTMEIALPREMFTVDMQPGVLKAVYGAGLSVGLSIGLNDSAKDAPMRKSSMIWGGNMMNYKDLSKLGTLVLLP